MLKMFTVRDLKADGYGVPFFLPTVGMAIRQFEDWIADPKTTIGAHPEDYQLVVIGYFDETTCEVGASPSAIVAHGKPPVPEPPARPVAVRKAVQVDT